MQAVYNTELSGKKITNPMDISELTEDMLGLPTRVVRMYSDLPKTPSEEEARGFWFVIETKKYMSGIKNRNHGLIGQRMLLKYLRLYIWEMINLKLELRI